MTTATERLLAFAFANADVLLEVDGQGVVQSGLGATRTLLHRTDDRLAGLAMGELIARADSGMVDAMLRVLPNNTRLNPVLVQLVTGTEKSLAATLGGYRLDGDDTRFYLTLCRARQPVPATADPQDTDSETGLLSGEAFNRTIQTRLGGANHPPSDAKLTLIRLDELPQFKTRVDGKALSTMMEEVGALLRAMSVDGNSAGRLGEDRFGLMHTPQVDTKALERNVAQISRDSDPTGQGLVVSGATVDLGGDELSEADRRRVVLYTVRKFSDTEGPVALGSLADGLKEVLANTVKRVQAFKQTLSNDRLNVALQPIVGLGDRRVHHFEALARPTDGQSPATMVGFAEEIGMTHDFDLLVCQKAIDILTEARARGTDASVAINLSAVSLDSQVFVKTFRALVAQTDGAVERLLIEVTESMRIKDLEATNTVLQVLRADGHKICLDDFGAGAASFPYIQALDIDYVKIDGAYVKRMETHPRDRAILKAMVGLCRDLGIGTVAEMVETEGQAKALVDLGVDYAQGYLFGRPSLEFNFPSASAAPLEFVNEGGARRLMRRQGSRETWG